MKLDEMMRDATDSTVVDLDRLTRGASSQGRGIRRRRRVLGTVAGAGAVAVSVAAVSLAMSLGVPHSAPDSPPDAGPAVSEAPATTVRDIVALNGRTTAALLQAQVSEQATGSQSDFAGQGGTEVGGQDTYAELVLAPAGEAGAGVVGVNVQDVSILDGGPYTCKRYLAECVVTKLSRGDVLRSYRDPSESAAGNDVRRVAELISRTRGLRVVVSATNGFDLSGNVWDVTRDSPVLSADQLSAIATDERWAFEVPAEYADLGAALAPYRDLDAASKGLVPMKAPDAG